MKHIGVILIAVAVGCSSSKEGGHEPAAGAGEPGAKAAPEAPATPPATPPAAETPPPAGEPGAEATPAPTAEAPVPTPAGEAAGEVAPAETEKCVNAASDFMDVACSTAWECDEFVYDVGCKSKKGDKNTVVCVCHWDTEDRTTFEMPRAECKQLGLAMVNERCKPPTTLVLDEDE